jgi:hypothetical protein
MPNIMPRVHDQNVALYGRFITPRAVFVAL